MFSLPILLVEELLKFIGRRVERAKQAARSKAAPARSSGAEAVAEPLF
jgi:chorismate mutase